jgi:hypothetical protein
MLPEGTLPYLEPKLFLLDIFHPSSLFHPSSAACTIGK